MTEDIGLESAEIGEKPREKCTFAARVLVIANIYVVVGGRVGVEVKGVVAVMHPVARIEVIAVEIVEEAALVAVTG